MIHPHLHEHIPYYLSMIVLQLIGFIIVLAASPNIPLQMALIVLTSGIYVFWASLHHFIHHSLHPKIVLEYALVSFLGISISYFLLRLQG